MTDTALYPYSLEAEQATLASLLIDPDGFLQVRDMLQAADFHDERNQRVFQAMCDGWDNGEPLDYVTVADRDRELQAYITGMIGMAPTGLYATHYAARVRRYADLRRYIEMGRQLVAKAHGDSDADELYAWVQEQLQTINMGRRQDSAVMTWEESFEVYDRILAQEAEEASKPDAERLGWEWPWASWNRYLSPHEPGMLAVIAAGTTVGKTTTAECIAEFWAKRGHKVAYVHFELNRRIMLHRRASRHSGLPYRQVSSGKLTTEQRGHLEDVKRRLLAWEGNIRYVHTPGWNMKQVVRELERLAEAGLCECVVVDYLEKAQSTGQQLRMFNNQFQREADDVEALKNFAEQYNVRAVVLSQLTKEGGDLPFGQLTLRNIRGAGEKTEKSNVVLLMHRALLETPEFNADGDILTEAGSRSQHVKYRVAKNTIGQQGVIEQYFNGPSFSVHDYDS